MTGCKIYHNIAHPAIMKEKEGIVVVVDESSTSSLMDAIGMVNYNVELQIRDVNANDILPNAGHGSACHSGNKNYLDIVMLFVYEKNKGYFRTRVDSVKKKIIAGAIIDYVGSLNPSGRFLDKGSRSDTFRIKSREESIKKVTQALRDHNRTDRQSCSRSVVAPEIRGIELQLTNMPNAQEHIDTALNLLMELTSSNKRDVSLNANNSEWDPIPWEPCYNCKG